MNINSQFEFLSQSFRIQLEQFFKYPELIKVDESEAIYNIENSVKSVFDAFHNIYDEINSITNKTINFYDYPELHLIIAIRNAKHHNNSMKSILFENSTVMYINFDSENTFPCLMYPVNWFDISNKLQSNKKSLAKYKDIRSYLHAASFENEASLNNLNVNQIYINIIPLLLQAGRKLVELCGAYITQKNSVESNFFYSHFQDLSDNFQSKTIFPYNKNQYSEDLKNLIRTANKVSNASLESNIYLKEITPKSLL